MYLFTVHDQESNTYLPPFTMKTVRDAIEGFRQVVNDEKTDYNKFPKDFKLVKLGEFNQLTAEIISHAPENIVGAIDLKKEE